MARTFSLDMSAILFEAKKGERGLSLEDYLKKKQKLWADSIEYAKELLAKGKELTLAS